MANGSESGDTYAGYYVVAWIDLLGQTQELEGIRAVASSPDKAFSEKQGELEERVRGCCRNLELVRSLFTKGCELTLRKTNPPPNVTLTQELQAELDAINSFEAPTFQGFGDTVIAFTPVKGRDGKLKVQAVDAFLGGCAMTMLMCLAEGTAIRGAVDVDFGFDCFDGEIYGPVAASVHKLEDEIAEYPRIVVGDGLRRYLSNFDAPQPDTCRSEGFSRELAGFCRRIIAPDVDGVWILDYAGAAVRERLSAWGEMNATLESARGFSNQEYAKFVANGDRKLALRYALLERYLDERIQA